jgi:uncharacterized SAM-binding protein YcdF (DUF218 family)
VWLPGAALLLVCAFAGYAAYIDRYGRTRPPPQAAAVVVVLGAKVMPDGRASPALERRVEAAAELFNQRLAPLIIFSGGAFGALPSEAKVMQQLALGLGVPASACLLEDQSHTTKENARFTAEILRARGIQQVLLVTDNFHLLRSVRLFKRQGVATIPVASKRVLTQGQRVRAAVREAIASLRPTA